ncbi:MAG: hypothetical protein AAGU04_07605 [Anaerolineaceae bacterium]
MRLSILKAVFAGGIALDGETESLLQERQRYNYAQVGMSTSQETKN